MNFLASLLSIEPSALGPSEWVYLFVVGAVVLGSFAFLARPFVNLSLAIFYLASANTYILGTTVSAMLAAVLIANCLVGTAIVYGLKLPLQRDSLYVPLPLIAIAMFGALYGFFSGNRTAWVLGDAYQIFELAALFLLTQTLVKTEERLRAIAIVLIGSIIATTVFQTLDALTDAPYLAQIHVARRDGDELIRTINMNAPIAFVVLIAGLPFARAKALIIAGIAIVEISLIWSFSRGLWAASIVALFFLLVMLRHSRTAILASGLAAAVFAFLVLNLFGVQSIAVDRIAFVLPQFLNTPEDVSPQTVAADQAASSPLGSSGGVSAQSVAAERPASILLSKSKDVRLPKDESGKAPQEPVSLLASRRRLEFDLLLPSILKHPLFGDGLGASFNIAGDAVLGGPKGRQVDYHFIHNLYLAVAFRLGMPALLIFLGILGSCFRYALKNLRTADLSPVNSALLAGMIAAIFGEAVLSLSSPTFLDHPTAGVIGCLMGLTMTKWRGSSTVSNSRNEADEHGSAA